MINYKINFPDFEASDFVYNDIVDRIEKLERFYDRIQKCEVFVRQPHKHSKTRIYHIQIRLTVPGKEIIVNREREKNLAHQDIYVAIRDSFNALTRQLEDYVKHRRTSYKPRLGPEHAKVSSFDPNTGFGFVKTPGGREIYFHENALVGPHQERLEVGSEVRFEEEMGEKGPQVTSMSLVGHQSHAM